MFKPDIQPWDGIQTKGAPPGEAERWKTQGECCNFTNCRVGSPAMDCGFSTGLRSGNLDLSCWLALCSRGGGLLRNLCLKLLDKIVIDQRIEVPGHSGKAVNDLDIAIVQASAQQLCVHGLRLSRRNRRGCGWYGSCRSRCGSRRRGERLNILGERRGSLRNGSIGSTGLYGLCRNSILLHQGSSRLSREQFCGRGAQGGLTHLEKPGILRAHVGRIILGRKCKTILWRRVCTSSFWWKRLRPSLPILTLSN